MSSSNLNASRVILTDNDDLLPKNEPVKKQRNFLRAHSRRDSTGSGSKSPGRVSSPKKHPRRKSSLSNSSNGKSSPRPGRGKTRSPTNKSRSRDNTAEADELRKRMDRLSGELFEKTDHIDELLGQIESLQSDLISRDQRIAELEAKLDEQDQELETLYAKQVNGDALADAVAQSGKGDEVEVPEEVIQQVEDTVTKVFEAQLADLQSEKDSLQMIVDNLEGDYHRRIKRLEEKNQRLQRKLKGK